MAKNVPDVLDSRLNENRRALAGLEFEFSVGDEVSMNKSWFFAATLAFASASQAAVCDWPVIGYFCSKPQITVAAPPATRPVPVVMNCEGLKENELVFCLKQDQALSYSLKTDPFFRKQVQNDSELQSVYSADAAFRTVIEELAVRDLYDGPSGVSEGYSVGQHTALALAILESQIPHFDFSTMKLPNYLVNPQRFMKYLVAFHDIGKTIGYKVYHNNSHEIEYSYPLAWRLMNNSKFSQDESKLAIALVHEHKVIGDFMQNKISLQEAKASIRRYAKFSACDANTFYSLLEFLYVADAGSYPYLRQKVFREEPTGKLVIQSDSSNELRNAVTSAK